MVWINHHHSLRALWSLLLRLQSGSGMTPLLRNDVARITQMLLSGELKVVDLSHIAIEHHPGCPMRDPRNQTCSCCPEVWVNGKASP